MYLLGNLIGRIIASYLIVWVICLLASRLNWRLAFKRSHRWYSLLAVILLTLLGLAVRIAKQGGL
jgi:formate/nitrite transporter FocA (FNT family)